MGFEDVPRCQHVKVNGVQCASPALRRKSHCYFHERAHYERKLAAENKSAPRNFGFPLLEDANSIQVALMKTVQMLGSGCLDTKTAGLMLYALQIASSNLRRIEFESQKPTDVVIDEDTVDLTRISGPQWSSHDFKKEDSKEEKSGNEGPAVRTSHSRTFTGDGDLARRRERKRHLLPDAEIGGKYTLAAHLLDRMVPGWREHGFKQEKQEA